MSNALDAASLIMIPSGYEDGTLGSVKPTDGTGDFTFTRGAGDTCTRIGEDGYIKKGYENLLLQSNTFSDAAWIGSNTTRTSGQVGYDGSNNAWLYEKQSTYSSIRQDINYNGVGTYSVYVKAGTLDWIRMGSSTGVISAWFDVQNGVVGFIGSSVVKAKIESVGNGWYRCSIAFNGSISRVEILGTEGNGTFNPSSGSVYIQDAMLNQGLVAYPYIETTTAPVAGGILEDMPRLDWSGSCPSLLLEPSRTNLFPHSEYFGSWILFRDLLIPNSTTSPEGIVNAYRFEETATTGEHTIRSAFPMTAGLNYVASVFVKAGELTSITLLSSIPARWSADTTTFSLSPTGSVISGNGTIEPVGNDWYRCSIQGPCILSSSSTGLEIRTINGAGTAGDGLYIYGAQVEEGSYPTSYIPTYGVSQTRLGDNINIPSSADLSIPSDSWTILWDLSDESIATGGRWISDSLNNINLYPVTPNKSRVYWRGISQYIASGGGSKIIARYDGTTATEFHDGINRGSASYSGQLPFDIRNEIQLNTGKYIFNKIVIFPTALSDDECIALTTL